MRNNTRIIVSLLLRAGVATGFLALTSGAAGGQNILSQFSVPHTQDQGSGYAVESQFVAPDGAGSLFTFDGSIHKFDSTGQPLWSSPPVGIAASLQGVVTGMAVTSSGIYLAGQVTGALPGQTSAGASDVFVQKYDLNGVVLWTRQFGTADGDFVRAIAPDSTGIYITGVTNGTSTSVFVSRYDGDGNQIWTRQAAGSRPMDILGAAADSTGIYFFGYSIMTASYNVMRKFDSAGNDLWTYLFDPFDVILGVAPDGQGAYVLFFENDDPGWYFVRRLDLTGSEVWTRRIVASYADGFISADTGGFYVAGTADTALSGQCYAGAGDVFLMKFDSAANNLWTREFGTAGPESQAQIAIGAASVDVTGFGPTRTTAFLTRIEKSSAPVTGSQPRILWECVLNAANYLGGGVAPGEIITILGSTVGPSELARFQVGSDGRVPTTLAGTRILFDGEPAPLIYVSDQQSSAIVPYDVAGKAIVNVQVEYNGVLSNAVESPVFESRVGIFSFGASGTGQAAVVDEDGTINSTFNPAARGSVVSIYGTGAGLPIAPGADDQITAGNPSPFKSSAYIRLTNDGSCDTPYFAAEVLYYGVAPQSVPGLIQINARLPVDVPVGDAVPLYFGLDPDSGIEQVVTIAIR